MSSQDNVTLAVSQILAKKPIRVIFGIGSIQLWDSDATTFAVDQITVMNTLKLLSKQGIVKYKELQMGVWEVY